MTASLQEGKRTKITILPAYQPGPRVKGRARRREQSSGERRASPGSLKSMEREVWVLFPDNPGLLVPARNDGNLY